MARTVDAKFLRQRGNMVCLALYGFPGHSRIAVSYPLSLFPLDQFSLLFCTHCNYLLTLTWVMTRKSSSSMPFARSPHVSSCTRCCKSVYTVLSTSTISVYYFVIASAWYFNRKIFVGRLKKINKVELIPHICPVKSICASRIHIAKVIVQCTRDISIGSVTKKCDRYKFIKYRHIAQVLYASLLVQRFIRSCCFDSSRVFKRYVFVQANTSISNRTDVGSGITMSVNVYTLINISIAYPARHDHYTVFH